MTSILAQVLADAVARSDVAMLIDLAHVRQPEVALPAVEAAIGLGARVDDEHRFGSAVYQCVGNQPGGLDRVVRAFVRLAEPPERAARALKHVLQAVAHDAADDDLFSLLWTWFERTAGPNQGEIVTELLMHGWPALLTGAGAPVRLRTVVEWVLRNGAGLLRGSGQGTTLRTLVVYVDALRPDLLPDAVTVMLDSRSRDEAMGCDGGVRDLLLPQMDRALGRGLDEALVVDVLQGSSQFRVMCGLPPLPATEMNHEQVRSAVGAYPNLLRTVVTAASAHADRAVHATLNATLRSHGCRDLVELAERMGSKNSTPTEVIEAIVRRVHQRDVRPEHRALVEHLALRRDTVDLIAHSLRSLARDPGWLSRPVADQVEDLLRDGDPHVVAVALRVSLEAGGPAGGFPELMKLDHVEDLLSELLSVPKDDSLHPFIASLVNPGMRVRISEQCPNSDYATELVAEHWVSGSRELYEQFLRRHGEDEGLQCCALYFAHEMLHHEQGLADKKDVVSLRKNGSELFVLELDMCADMLAIEWLARLGRPGWTREALHDLTLRLFDEFPATATHIQPSLTRKSLRLWCHVLTLLHRPHGYGWAWLELPAVDGEATVWWSHPDSHRIMAFPMDAEDVKRARRAAFGHSLDALKAEAATWMSRSKAKSRA